MRHLANGVLLAGLAAVGFSAVAGDNSWQRTAGGTYDWNVADNWTGGIPTASDTVKFNNTLSGNQVVTGSGVAGVLDINNSNAKTREFTGEVTAGSLIFRQGILNVNVTGSLILTDDSGSVSRIGTSQNPASGSVQQEALHIFGKLTAPNRHGLCIARSASNDGSTANGYLHLHEGGELAVNTNKGTSATTGLLLARTSGGTADTLRFNAGFVQEGGKSAIGRLMVGYERGSRASVAVLGGEMELKYVDDNSRYRIGHGGYGQFQQLGGMVFALTNQAMSVNDPFSYSRFEVGGGSAATDAFGASFYCAGGTFDAGTTEFLIQGNPSKTSSDATAAASATLDGNGSLTCWRFVVGANNTPGRAILNLNGAGRVETVLMTNRVSRAGGGEINANGGTVAFKKVSAGTERMQFAGVDAIDVYEGGLTIQCDVGVKAGSADLSPRLRSPKGYGVESIDFTGTGEYYYAPWVDISGGSGSNATAVALVDWAGTHRITNIVVTCRGEGYLPDDKLTVKLTKPDVPKLEVVDAARVSVTLSENLPGAVVKTGAGRLVLYAQPDYDGVYEIRAGLVIQSTGDVGSPKVSEIRVGGVDAEFQCASGNRFVLEEDRINQVNTNAVLTLGTAFGPGAFSLPIGRADDKPYVQKLAKLQVRGTGNAIRGVSGEIKVNRPVRLIFGALDFAEGSQVVLATNSEFRVYAPASMAGEYLENVTFEGLVGKRVGYVAEDGQIVPKSNRGLVIVIQ